MSKDKKAKIKLGILIFIVVGTLIFGVIAAPYLMKLSSPATQHKVVELIRAQGIWGAGYLLLIQCYQMIIFIIPGELVEVAAGILYGTLLGFLLCSFGAALGGAIIYKMVKFLGYDIVSELAFAKKFQELSFLNRQQSLDRLVFILFLIPGTPKDALTYFIPFTKMSLKRFLIISGIARIPSVLSSTYAGALLGEGRVTSSLTVFILIAITAGIGILIHRIMINRYNT